MIASAFKRRLCLECTDIQIYTGNAGWVRMQRTDVIKTRLISVLMGAKMQRLEVVRGHSEFLSHFSIPQANPTQVACEWSLRVPTRVYSIPGALLEEVGRARNDG